MIFRVLKYGKFVHNQTARMKRSLILLTAITALIVACDKDSFQTKPTIKIKSVNADFIGLNQPLVLTLECTDKEGDVKDTITLIKRRLNQRPVGLTLFDTIRYQIPVFPNTPRTEIEVTVDYQLGLIHAAVPPFIPGSNPPQREPDSLIFRILVKDRAGNTSDTIESPRIIVYRQ
jgi:hypothetical protein